MLRKTQGIVLHNVNYRDNSVISQIYTRDFGRQSYLIHGVRNQRGPIRPSHLMPLNLVDMEVYHNPSKDIQQIKELRCNPILQNIHFDLRKNTIALFVAEVSTAVLHEETAHEDLFQFLHHFIHVLDLEDGAVANYPGYFLMELTKYLGVRPKGEYTDGDVFMLLEGAFVSPQRSHGQALDPVESQWWWKCLSSNLDEWQQTAVPNSVRSALIDHLLLYYDLHGLPGKRIKSHLVLRETLR
ncbi:MAG: DNA repair protein RecO [Flavobacteriales bacterium]|nr:DNA repair protein RecO [Flavobacteriales bacterium]